MHWQLASIVQFESAWPGVLEWCTCRSTCWNKARFFRACQLHPWSTKLEHENDMIRNSPARAEPWRSGLCPWFSLTFQLHRFIWLPHETSLHLPAAPSLPDLDLFDEANGQTWATKRTDLESPDIWLMKTWEGPISWHQCTKWRTRSFTSMKPFWCAWHSETRDALLIFEVQRRCKCEM